MCVVIKYKNDLRIVTDSHFFLLQEFIDSVYVCFSCILICFFLDIYFFFTDEVGALVFDMGSYSVRAGYAGEDCPKV